MWWMFLLIAAVLTLTTIGLFYTIPPPLRALLAVQPFLGAAANFGISYVILMFVSAGLYAGIGNLTASLVFVVFLRWYKKKYSCSVVWEPKWGFIPNWRITWRN